MGLFDIFKKKEPTPEPAKPEPKRKPIRGSGVDPNPLPGCKQIAHKVAGTSFRKDAIMTFAQKNPKYGMNKSQMLKAGILDEPVYEYLFTPGIPRLELEPDNKADPNAIKVLLDDMHVGYIKAGSCAHVRNILTGGKIKRMQVEIGGGKCDILESPFALEGVDDKPTMSNTHMEHEATNLSVKLYIDEEI